MKLLSANHPDTARTMADLAIVLEQLKQNKAAESMYKEAVSRLTQSQGKEHRDTQVSRMCLALFLVHEGRRIEADQLLESIYTEELLASPRAIPFLRDRTGFYARQGRWQEAAADYQRLLAFEPTNHVYHHWLGSLLLMSGDTNRYRALCKRAAQIFLDTSDPVTAERTAYLCLQLPDSGVSLENIGRMAGFAARGPLPKRFSYMIPFQHLDLSFLCYREGRYAEAVAHGEAASRLPADAYSILWTPRKSCRVLAHLVRAMAYQKMGQPESASVEMAKAADLQKELPSLNDRDLGESWIDVLKIKLMLDEATQVLGTPVPATTRAAELSSGKQ